MLRFGTRRFGLLLTGVRARWCRWLVAALVASLVAAPVAGAAALRKGTPGAGSSHPAPVASTAAVPTVAVGILTELLKGAAYTGGKIGFGRLLETFGLADPPVNDTTASELSAVRAELRNIQSRLTGLETAVSQLRSEVAQSEYSVLVGQAVPITSEIDTGMDYLDAVASTAPGDPAKKGFAQATLDFIGSHLLHSRQRELAQKITGVAGSDGLIKAFSKAIKARTNYWTNRQSDQVREVYDYYQAEEVRLLLLRVEYWHAHPLTYPASYIRAEIKKVEDEVGTPIQASGEPAVAGTQHALLKPSPGPDILADTRTDLDWSYHDFHYAMTGEEAIRQVARYGPHWYLPTAPQVRDLVSGWDAYSGERWWHWLDGQIGGEARLNNVVRLVRTPTGWRFENTTLNGVWASSPFCSASSTTPACHAIDLRIEEVTVPNDRGGLRFASSGANDDEGLLFYRYRTHTYWW